VWVEAPAVVDLDTRVLGCRVAGALIDLVPLTLLMLGFASMWLRLGKQADGSSELSLFGWAFVGCGGWNRGALVL
jgi:hypothetical protein